MCSIISNDFASRQQKSAPISAKTAQRVGANIKGAKFLILDEVSLVSLEQIFSIHERLQKALLTTTDYDSEREYIMRTPFGGIHILFAGDFWQLQCCSGTPIYCPNPTNDEAKEGRKIWLNLNAFVKSTENCRFLNGELSPFAACMAQARTATPTRPMALHNMGLRNKQQVIGESEARARAHPNALWIADTLKDVEALNRCQLNQYNKKSQPYVDLVSDHASCATRTSRRKLLSTTDPLEQS
jgi:hypothetical protein